MPFIVKEDPSEYPLCPEGLHPAVLVDAVDLGEQSSPWGSKHKLSLIFETQEKAEEDKTFILSKRYTWSLHEKSNLRKDLERFRGDKFLPRELQEGVDLEYYIGMSCQILVVHNEVEERTFANIESVLPYKDSATGEISYFALKPSGDYIRAIDRPDYKTPEEYSKAADTIAEEVSD
ncbi:phage replication initiation protein, NGO0469 family [Gracilimonas sediminicola]|uniref:phage replication initiation protein, NGO0469 family n=1 Tax=Gracilimonas sediminicola TaxID=2952158 RepID=UPI0038D44210